MISALTDFQDDIARINRVADWLASPPALHPDMRPAAQAISCGCVVLLAGYFESFLKDCMRIFITSVNDLNKPLTKMPDDLRYRHFEKGGRALERQLKIDRANRDTAPCEDLATRLASLSSQGPYQYAWEAFADTQANPGPVTVEEMISAVGIKDVWRKIKAETSEKGDLNLFLKTFMAIRDDCAHTGGANSTPTATDLTEYGENLYAFAQAMVKVLHVRFAELAAL